MNAGLVEILVGLLGGMALIYSYSKVKNNSVLKQNHEVEKKVEKLEGKLEVVADQEKEIDKEIESIKKETNEEIAKTQTLKQLSDFFNSVFK